MPVTRAFRLLAAVASLVIAAMLCACEPSKLTQENYDKIKVGMMISEARGILGSQGEDETPDPGVNLSGGGLMGSGGKPDNIYVFKAKDFKIVLTVKDGKIVQKSKVDL